MSFNSQQPTSTGSGLKLVGGSAQDPGGALAIGVLNDANPDRLQVLGDGSHVWGDGTLAGDTFMQRLWPGILNARGYSKSPVLFDHFLQGAGALNSSLPQLWVNTETGTGTSHAVFVPAATNIGGTVAGVAGGTTNNAQELAGKNVGWQVSTMANATSKIGGIVAAQAMVFETRMKCVGSTTATDGDFYFGMANAVTYTSGLPFILSAASIFTTYVPVEFVGFGYTSLATSGPAYTASGNLIFPFAQKNSAVPAVTAGGIVKDSAYHTYTLVMDKSANTKMYIDGVLVATIAAAFTAATALTPYFNVVSENSHANTMTIDYILVAGDLV